MSAIALERRSLAFVQAGLKNGLLERVMVDGKTPYALTKFARNALGKVGLAALDGPSPALDILAAAGLVLDLYQLGKVVFTPEPQTQDRSSIHQPAPSSSATGSAAASSASATASGSDNQSVTGQRQAIHQTYLDFERQLSQEAKAGIEGFYSRLAKSQNPEDQRKEAKIDAEYRQRYQQIAIESNDQALATAIFHAIVVERYAPSNYAYQSLQRQAWTQAYLNNAAQLPASVRSDMEGFYSRLANSSKPEDRQQAARIDAAVQERYQQSATSNTPTLSRAILYQVIGEWYHPQNYQWQSLERQVATQSYLQFQANLSSAERQGMEELYQQLSPEQAAALDTAVQQRYGAIATHNQDPQLTAAIRQRLIYEWYEPQNYLQQTAPVANQTEQEQGGVVVGDPRTAIEHPGLGDPPPDSEDPQPPQPEDTPLMIPGDLSQVPPEEDIAFTLTPLPKELERILQPEPNPDPSTFIPPNPLSDSQNQQSPLNLPKDPPPVAAPGSTPERPSSGSGAPDDNTAPDPPQEEPDRQPVVSKNEPQPAETPPPPSPPSEEEQAQAVAYDQLQQEMPGLSDDARKILEHHRIPPETVRGLAEQGMPPHELAHLVQELRYGERFKANGYSPEEVQSQAEALHEMVNQGMRLNKAEEVLKTAAENRHTLEPLQHSLELARRLADSGNLRNPLGLRKNLKDITDTIGKENQPGYIKELELAIERASQGHDVQLGPVKDPATRQKVGADVVDHTTEEAVQSKHVSSADLDKVADNVREAASQLAGDNNDPEIVPVNSKGKPYERIIDVTIANPDNPLYSADVKILKESIQETIIDKDERGKAYWWQSVDTVKITNGNGTFEFRIWEGKRPQFIDREDHFRDKRSESLKGTFIASGSVNALGSQTPDPQAALERIKTRNPELYETLSRIHQAAQNLSNPHRQVWNLDHLPRTLPPELETGLRATWVSQQWLDTLGVENGKDRLTVNNRSYTVIQENDVLTLHRRSDQTELLQFNLESGELTLEQPFTEADTAFFQTATQHLAQQQSPQQASQGPELELG